MSNKKPDATNNEAREEFKISVDVHEEFNGIVEQKFISSNEFCRKVTELFKSIYADCEGCIFETNQQGLSYISLFFNHSEPTDDAQGRTNGVTRVMPDGGNSKLKNETVIRIRQNDARNRQGDRYYLTDDGREGIDDFIHDSMINKKDGKVMWDKIMAEVAQQQAYYGQPNIVYTKISLLDPVKLATAIYGSVDEDGNNLAYGVNILRSVPQMVGMGTFQPQWMLSIQKVSEVELQKLCNQLGVAPAQGLDIIR